MLIDQFTEEQLAQIRKELREVQRLSKASLNYEISSEVEKIFDTDSYRKECLFPYRVVTDAIGVIVDYTTDNFVYKNQGRSKKQIGWYRSQTISAQKEDECRQIVGEIINIIKKHKTTKEFSLKKPGEQTL